MSKDTTPKKTSAVAAAIEILTAAGEPMHVKAITEKILSDYDTGLKGKTPAATLGAKLHLAAKKGETFAKTGPGTFGLIGGAAAAVIASESQTEEVEAPAVEADPESPLATPNAKVVRQGKAPQAKPHPKPAAKRTRAKAGAAA